MPELRDAGAIDGTEAPLCAGVCLGKFTHSRKFRLQVTCLDLLSKLAKHKVWVKSNGEQSFLYGNNIVKAHLKRITEDTPKNAGVLVRRCGLDREAECRL